MPDLTHCPCCDAPRIGEGPASADQYQDGLWIGCTACGFSISGPDHAAIRAAWASCCRSTALRDLRLGPGGGRMTALPLTFAETCPGGRILLMLGAHQAGAVFPPCGDPPDRLPWVWRWWLGGTTATKEGRAKTEQAAKNAILAEGRDWLRKAGLQDG